MDAITKLCTARNVTVAVAAVFGTSIWLFRRYLVGRRCTNTVRLHGKTVIVTGANSGIGKATALELARRGARVIMACRDLESAEKAASEIRYKVPKAEVVCRFLDLNSLISVRKFAEDVMREEKRLDILVNNAGVYQPANKKTVDGFETQFGVNHLGHFLLTNMLLDLLKASAPSRIVVVSSRLGFRANLDFDAFDKEDTEKKSMRGGHVMPVGYGRSKLANFLFTHELSKRLPQGVTVNALCPGMVWTGLGRTSKMSWKMKLLFWPLGFLFLKRPMEGAQTVIYCATEPELSNVSGKCFTDCHQTDMPANCTDDETAKRLWNVSEILTGLSF
ncbi:retinol dehydrogenase 14 [Nematostella vectensis]|uniref:retinol dehydrogenase 14 n=1 Tax=Nematostella vectensis TaxID=45351 RepID=UPI002076F90F|nr:retinol dehydrogenase 14 [Nematostella vectensis]